MQGFFFPCLSGDAAAQGGLDGLVHPLAPFFSTALQVKCSVCEYVTPVGSASRPQHQPQHQPQQQQLGAQGGQQSTAAASNKPPTTTTVLVENPAGLDESGNELVNVAIGVAPK